MQPQEATTKLLSRITQGDEKAFRELFDLYRDRLYGYIYRIIKSREVAEELVMDVFMKIWLGKAMLPGISRFDSFLFRIAFNQSIDFLRVAGRDPVLHELIWENLQYAADQRTDAHLLEEEYAQKLRQAVGLLPPQRGKIFRMSRIEGLSHREIAARLRISHHTVNNHIVEAKNFLRSYLSENFELGILIVFFLMR